MFTWTGAALDGDFYNVSNWEERYTHAAVSAVPGDGDDAYYDGAVSSLDCDNLGIVSTPSTTGVFASLRLVGGYAGWVTLATSISVQTLELTSGTLDQPEWAVDPGTTDINVLSHFAWTGGTLNSTPTLSTLFLNGATALIAPEGGGTVNLGSSLSLVNGAVATLREGTIAVTNEDVEININEDCSLVADPGQVDPGQQRRVTRYAGVDTITRGPTMFIRARASFTVLTGDYNAGNCSLVVTGGSLVLEGDTTAFFLDLPTLSPPVSVLMHSGAIYLAADASLSAFVRVEGGEISVKTGEKPEGFAGNIFGGLTLAGGSITFDPGAGTGYRGWGEFRVFGDVNWGGGVYYPYVSLEYQGDNADLWRVNGIMTIGQAARVEPMGIYLDGVTDTPPSGWGFEWRLLESAFEIRPAAGNPDPGLTAGYSFVKDPANPKKWWKLKRN